MIAACSGPSLAHHNNEDSQSLAMQHGSELEHDEGILPLVHQRLPQGSHSILVVTSARNFQLGLLATRKQHLSIRAKSTKWLIRAMHAQGAVAKGTLTRPSSTPRRSSRHHPAAKRGLYDVARLFGSFTKKEGALL